MKIDAWKIIMIVVAVACLAGAGGLLYFGRDETIFETYVHIEGKNETFYIYKSGNIAGSVGFIEGYMEGICSRFNATYNLTKDIRQDRVKYVYIVNITEEKVNEFINLLWQIKDYGYGMKEVD